MKSCDGAKLTGEHRRFGALDSSESWDEKETLAVCAKLIVSGLVKLRWCVGRYALLLAVGAGEVLWRLGGEPVGTAEDGAMAWS